MLTTSIVLNGCAYSYVDESGTKHIVGFVDLEIQPAPDDGTYAGQVIDMRSFGITLNVDELGGNFSIGYNRNLSGYIDNHALVKGNPFEFPENVNQEGL